MGPRRRSRGKRRGQSRERTNDPQLQWGHDEGVVENARGVVRPCAVLKASMGPRRRSRGRPFIPEEFRAVTNPLQWGHDEGVVENEGHWNGSAMDTTLQWGHDEGVVENGRKCRAESAEVLASMGPRRRSRGKREGAEILRARPGLASMGPRRRSRGRPVWEQEQRTA